MSKEEKLNDMEPNRRRSSRTSRTSEGRMPEGESSEERQELVILRRKGSMDPPPDIPGDRRSSSYHYDHRPSKVPSVTQDVMSGEPIRMMGYMEKRSKLLGWKKFWFVLDGHLLQYFKSRADYENLSTFVGSISLGNVSTVRPIQIKHCKGYPMQIVSRNQVYLLRCLDKSVLEEWVLALQETISIPPRISSPVWTDPGVQFYRYSFAALSQWSLEDNPCDISGSLGNLPKNFYLKHEKSGFGLHNPPLKKKCQSFANLPTESELGDAISLTTSQMSSSRSSQSLNFGKGDNQDGKKRFATSLLVLESSPQATELKRELATKLAIGQSMPSTIRKFEHSNLSQNQSKSIGEKLDGGVGDTSTFHRSDSENLIYEDGIYEPVDFPRSQDSSVEAWRINSKLTPGTLSQSSSLASIAEGYEPNFTKQPLNPSSRKIENEETELRKKKKGIGNLIQKIFKRESSYDGGRKRKKGVQEAMVISGPIDLRAHRAQTQTHVFNTSQSSLIDSSSPPSSRDPHKIHHNVQNTPIKNEAQAMITELKNLQLRRNTSKSQSSSLTELNKVKEDELIQTQEKENENLNASSLSPNYHEKLAKFNRLSAHLNPSFIALLNNSPNNSTSNVAMGRSTSFRVQSAVELDKNEPPLLPPKKRNTQTDTGSMGKYSSYDIPKNNRPVYPIVTSTANESTPPQVLDSNNDPLTYISSVLSNERKISLRELLSKKNSAPEINFGKPKQGEESQLSNFLNNDDAVLIPPPRPPKTQNETREPVGSTSNVNEGNEIQESTSESEELETEKSMDIENIDILSEFSDGTSNYSDGKDTLEPIYSTVAESLPELELESDNLNSDPIYESIQYATIGTILTELEAVEEQGDEEDELYDEFIVPMEPFHLPTETLEQIDSPTQTSSLTHSGMSALRNYLDAELNCDGPIDDFLRPSGPAVNRLGHSSAVKTLENLLQNKI